MSNAKILIVEDEGIVALDLQQILIRMGYFVSDIASTGKEAIKKAGETCPDLVLMDIMLHGEIDGTKAAGQIRDRFDIPVIYLTAYANEDTLQRAKVAEPYGYIIKPFNERDLHIAIDMALYKHDAERKLKESKKWFATTLSSIGDAVITTDKNGLITFMNPVAEKLTGWKMEEILNNKLTEVFNILNMHSRKPVENPVTKVLLEGSTVSLANHTLFIARDGTEIPIDGHAAPIKDDKENIVGVVFVFRDITERYQAEKALRKLNEELDLRVRERTSELESLNQALRESEERYRQIVETASEGIWVLDSTCRTTFVNKKIADMLDCTAREIIGKSLYDFIDDELTETVEYYIKRHQQGIADQFQLKFRRKDGNELWAILSVSPFFETNGQYSGVLAMVTDITKRKRLEKEMARLDRLNLVGEMAAGIGHEIRNPMTTVRGFLQMLGCKEECAKFRNYFNLMIEELDRANSIITEYLSLAKNKVTNKTPTNLNTILKSLLPLIQADAIKSDKNLVVELGEIPDFVSNEKEIRQVILNLVRNGLEASSPGSDLSIRTFTDSEEVVLVVQDKGEGIRPDVLEKIGTPFFTTKDNGTGLGLAVCYSIAARHDAKIDIKTGPTGTTFFLRFKKISCN